MNDALFTDEPAPKGNDSLFTDEPAPPNMLESAIHGVVNNVPLGPQIAAGADTLASKMGFADQGKNKPTYSENLEKYNQAFAAGKKAHPVAYGAGAVTGALAPLAIPGVGEALEAAPITGNAALGAANAVSNTDLLKNPGEAAKQAAVGAGMGAGAAWGLGKLFPQAETLEKAAESKGLASTGIGQKYLAEMKPEEFEASKRFVSDNGLIGTNKEEVLQKALQKQKDLGQTIGQIGKTLDSAGVRADASDYSKAMEALQSKLDGVSDVEYKTIKDLAPRYQEAMKDIANTLDKDPSWASIQQLKQKYGETAFDNLGDVKEKPAADTYFTLRDMLRGLTEKAQSNPNLPNEYKQALSGYHTIDPVIEGLQKAVGAERAGVAGHAAGHGFLPRIIRSLPGQSNPAVNLGTAALATMVSPHLGPLMALPTLTNPAIQSKAFSAAAKALPGIQQAATQEVTDFLTSRYAKPKNYMEK